MAILAHVRSEASGVAEADSSGSYASGSMADLLQHRPVSLYAVLGECAPATSIRGETQGTKAKETIDRDVEMLVLEELMDAA